MEMEEKSLFVINSPFQALCAFEAIKHYGINNPVFYVFDCGDSRDKILMLLNGKSCYEAEIIPFVGTKELISVIKAKPKYHQIFIGDYFSYNQYLIGILLSKRNTKIVYLDDGTATLDLLPNVGRKRYHGFKLRTFSYLYLNFCRKIKRVKESFYSIFDISGKVSYPVVENDFSCLKANSIDSAARGIYIIGTNSSAISFKGKTYPDLLCSLGEIIKDKYPNEEVFYCPHRRDTNNYVELLEKLQINIYQTEISVEVDFATKEINPLFIIGFASTALITLKRLYPQSKVQSIRFEIEDPFTKSSIRSIEEYYSNHGVEIIEL